jgi:hypothetical protein
MSARKTIDAATRQAVLLEAGYQCGNPSCRHIITLELHHIEWVKDGGGNGAENLIALCPNCHSLHTLGLIPREAIEVWKGVLISLMNPNRASADILLALADDEARFESLPDPQQGPPRFRFSGDSLGFLSGLLAADLAEIGRRFSGMTAWGATLPSFEVQLTPRGRAFVAAWRAGSAAGLRKALGYADEAEAEAEEPR